MASRSAESCRDKALRLLAQRPHFEAELLQKLSARGFGDEEILQTLANLEAQGYLDDRRHALEMAQGPLSRKGYGPRRMRAELERRGVDGEIAENAVAAVYGDLDAELKAARRALSKRSKGPGDRASAGRYLERRGFSTGVILTVLDDIEVNTDS